MKGNASHLDQDSFDYESMVQLVVRTQYIYLTLAIINVLFHAVGVFLLVRTYKRQSHVQHVYLLNLAVIELLRNVLWCADSSLIVTYFTSQYQDSNIYLVFSYLSVVRFTSLSYLYFLTMFLIVADRLSASFLDAKYKVVCTRKRAKTMVVFIWCVSWFVTFPCISWLFFADGMHTLNEEGITDILIVYIQTGLAAAFLFFSMISYAAMFVKYLQTKRHLASSYLSFTKAFRRSKFYASIVLVSSSLFLMVTPLLLYTISRKMNIYLPPMVNMYIDCSLLLSDTADAVVYVFLYQPVRTRVARLYWKATYSVLGRRDGCVVAQSVRGGHLALLSVLPTHGRKYIKECETNLKARLRHVDL